MQLPIRVYYGNMAQRYSNSLKKVKVYLLNKVKMAFLPPFLRQNATLTLSFPYLVAYLCYNYLSGDTWTLELLVNVFSKTPFSHVEKCWCLFPTTFPRPWWHSLSLKRKCHPCILPSLGRQISLNQTCVPACHIKWYTAYCLTVGGRWCYLSPVVYKWRALPT